MYKRLAGRILCQDGATHAWLAVYGSFIMEGQVLETSDSVLARSPMLIEQVCIEKRISIATFFKKYPRRVSNDGVTCRQSGSSKFCRRYGRVGTTYCCTGPGCPPSGQCTCAGILEQGRRPCFSPAGVVLEGTLAARREMPNVIQVALVHTRDGSGFDSQPDDFKKQ